MSNDSAKQASKNKYLEKVASWTYPTYTPHEVDGYLAKDSKQGTAIRRVLEDNDKREYLKIIQDARKDPDYHLYADQLKTMPVFGTSLNSLEVDIDHQKTFKGQTDHPTSLLTKAVSTGVGAGLGALAGKALSTKSRLGKIIGLSTGALLGGGVGFSATQSVDAGKRIRARAAHINMRRSIEEKDALLQEAKRQYPDAFHEKVANKLTQLQRANKILGAISDGKTVVPSEFAKRRNDKLVMSLSPRMDRHESKLQGLLDKGKIDANRADRVYNSVAGPYARRHMPHEMKLEAYKDKYERVAARQRQNALMQHALTLAHKLKSKS